MRIREKDGSLFFCPDVRRVTTTPQWIKGRVARLDSKHSCTDILVVCECIHSRHPSYNASHSCPVGQRLLSGDKIQVIFRFLIYF